MKFHIGTVLTIVGGDKMMSPNGVGDVYAILNYMTRDSLFTHQLPRVQRECRPWILRQHPQLEGYDDSQVTADNAAEFLAKQVEKYGEFLEVERIPQDDHDRKNPIEELREMTGKEPLIVSPDD